MRLMNGFSRSAKRIDGQRVRQYAGERGMTVSGFRCGLELQLSIRSMKMDADVKEVFQLDLSVQLAFS